LCIEGELHEAGRLSDTGTGEHDSELTRS